jgi:tetratricopeptide (TPR) repeat protein
MTAGDRATAASLLADSARAETPARLLWDAGALGVIAERLPDRTDPLDMALCADASFLLGNKASATAAYAELIERFPSWSWKPYAMLARAAYDEPEPLAASWPHEADPESYAARSAPEAMADSFLARMAAEFPGDEGVVLERARMAMLRGRPGEAFSLAGSLDGESGAMARLAYGPKELRVPAAMRLVSDYGGSAAAFDAALEALAVAGAWGRFSEVLAVAEEKGIGSRRSWFWRALGMALSGDTASASEAIEKYGPAEAGYAGALDLGILAIASNRTERALQSFEIATGLAMTAADRASALILTGDAHASMGRPDLAKSAWEAALGVDPDSRSARARLLRLETGK